MVIEVGKCHETYNDLHNDADIKHFSIMTSVRVWIGVKLYPGTARMRAMFRLRDAARGFGTLAGSGADTGWINLSEPTNVEFIIPKAEVFFGVPQHLIPPTLVTVPGPSALPAPVPPAIQGPTDDLVLPLEEIRSDTWEEWV